MTEPIPIPDHAYTLPAFVDDAQLRDLYEVIVARMRREAEGLRMTTVQELLIERIAYNYIICRWRENRGLGEVAGFEHTNAAKSYQQFWLDMTRVFHQMLGDRDDANIRSEVESRVARVINGALGRLDAGAARVVREALADALSAEGL